MAALQASSHLDACRQGLEKLRDSRQLGRAAQRKVERTLNSPRALKKFASHVKDSIVGSEGADSPILDKLQAVIDWIVANQDKIMAIIAFIMKIAPLFFV